MMLGGPWTHFEIGGKEKSPRILFRLQKQCKERLTSTCYDMYVQ